MVSCFHGFMFSWFHVFLVSYFQVCLFSCFQVFKFVFFRSFMSFHVSIFLVVFIFSCNCICIQTMCFLSSSLTWILWMQILYLKCKNPEFEFLSFSECLYVIQSLYYSHPSYVSSITYIQLSWYHLKWFLRFSWAPSLFLHSTQGWKPKCLR